MKNIFITLIFFNAIFLNIYGQFLITEYDYTASINKSILTDRTYKNPSYYEQNNNWNINSFLGGAYGRINLDLSFHKSLRSIKSTVGAKYNMSGHDQIYNLDYSYSTAKTKIKYSCGINLGYQRIKSSMINFNHFTLSETYQYRNSFFYRIGTSIELFNQNLGIAYTNKYYLFKNLIFLNYTSLISINNKFSIEPELFAYFNSSSTNIVPIINLGFNNSFYFAYLNNTLSTHALRVLYSTNKKIDFGIIIGSENNIKNLNLLGFKIQYNRK